MPHEPEPWGTNILPPDMQEVLTCFNEEAKKVLESSLGYLGSQEPPKFIYHYTDDRGLRGILEGGCFWLTDVFSLNDPSEMAHGFTQAVKVLNARAATGPPESQTFTRSFEAFVLEGAIQKIAHFLFVHSAHVEMTSDNGVHTQTMVAGTRWVLTLRLWRPNLSPKRRCLHTAMALSPFSMMTSS
jgi:hypothetical protein